MKILFFYILFTPAFLFAQNNYVVEYSHTNSVDFTCKSFLYTNDKECMYKLEDERPSGEISMPNGGVGFITNDSMSEFFYYTNNVSYHRFLYQDLEWFYTDFLESKLNYVINNDVKKTIKQYTCTEAKVRINGRNFTIWFTYDVPFKYGPLKFQNLPGLIVEVIEDDSFLKISLVSIKKSQISNKFVNVKKYISDWKNLSNYTAYSNDLSEYFINEKLRAFAMIKEAGGDGTKIFSDEYNFNFILDIPGGIFDKLKRIR